MGMVMFPKVESDYAFCEAMLPYGSPASRLAIVENRLVAAAETVGRENGGHQLTRGVFSKVDNNRVRVYFYLTDARIRPMGTTQVAVLWRKLVGPITGL
jgi:hypothetical protein